MKRVSVTTLEKFRRMMVGASPYDTEEALIESLEGKFEGNDKTRTGSAYHKLIEGEFKDVGGIHFTTADGYTFSFTPDQVKPALDYRKSHPAMTNEVDVREIYHTQFGAIQVTGRVDVLEGMIVRDIKTRFRSINDNDYADSCQWKFYLEMLGADEFYYDVFEFKHFKDLPDAKLIHLPKEVEVIPHEPIHCLRYDGMAGDCQAILQDFMDYLSFRKLHLLLKPAIEKSFHF